MHRFEETFTVAERTPQEVFDFVADPANGTAWVSAAKEVRAEGEPGVGRVFHAKAGFLGVSFDAEQQVTAYDPPEHYAWAGDKPFHAAYDFRFSPASDTGTQVTAVMETDPGKFFKVGGRLVARQIAKQFRGDVNRLRELLEQR